MASNSETLQLTAQVIDKFSAPIRDLQRSMRTMSEQGKAVHIEGARYAKAHKDSFEALRKTARETSDHFKNVFQPAMVGLGLSGISAAAGIAALTKGIKDLGEFGREMSFLTKETGLSTNELNNWVEAGARAGLTFGQITQDLKGANQEIAQFRMHRGPLMEFFAVNAANPVIAKLRADILASKDEAEAVEDIYKALGKLPDATKHLLEEATHLDEFHRISPQARAAAAAQTHQFTEQELEDLKRQQEAFDDTAAAAKKLATEIELSLSPAFKEVADGVKAFLDEHGADLKQFLGEVADDIKSADWKGFAEGIGKTATETKKLIDAVGGANVFQGLIALKLGGVPGLAALGAYKMLPSPTNEAESEIERQKKLGMPQPPTVDLHGAAPAAPDKNPAGGGFHFFKDKPPSIWEYENPSAEKMSYRGRIPDLQKPDMGGLQKAAYRTGGEETPGAEIRAEAVMTRATMRGTAEGSRIGVLAAFREWMDEQKRGAGGGGGGIQTAAYHPGEGTGGAGGLGGGYGGLGGGAGGGLGGGAGSAAPGGGVTSAGSGEHPLSAHAAAMRKQFGHPSKGGAGSILGEIDKAAGGDTRVADAMKAIFSGESLHNKGYDLGDYVGGKPTSFGPFQVHFARDHKAIGDQMLAAGIDARDPKTIPAQAKWIADYLKSHPHMNIQGVWHGYNRGLGQIAAGRGQFGGGGYEGGAGRTAKQHQALIETAKRVNPATFGNVGKSGSPIAAGAELPHMKGHDVDTAHVNPELQDVLNRASQYLPKGYHAEVQSGFRRGDPRFHGRGMAEDIALFGPDGKPLPNYQSGANFRAYEQFAQNARKIQHDLHPDLDNKLRWGGYFGGAKGKYGAMDTMHFDLGGEHLGMAGGSWEGGLKNKNFPGAKSVPMGPVAQYKLPGKEQGIPPEVAKREKEQSGSALRDIHRRAQSLFGHPHMQRADLLGNARKAGMMGAEHKVTGSASLSVDFKNMPRGVKAKTKIDGMFSQIRVARGRAMPLANQDS